MKQQSLGLLVVKTIFFDVLYDIIRFPLWWYSRGLQKSWDASIDGIRTAENRLALGIWLKNIGKPMFGQHDIWGRVISFFIRILQIIVRSGVLIAWSMFLLLRVVFWVFAPILIVWQLAYQVGL